MAATMHFVKLKISKITTKTYIKQCYTSRGLQLINDFGKHLVWNYHTLSESSDMDNYV